MQAELSHRRYDERYHNKVHRIERCVFRDNFNVKTNGATGNPDCIIVWVNNLYVNSWLSDYHKGWTNWHIHETYCFDDLGTVLVKNRGMRNCRTAFANCLFVAPKGMDVVYWQSGKAEKDGYRLFRAERFLYLMPPPNHWMRGQDVDITDRDAWIAEGLERDCRIVNSPAGFVVDPSTRDLRLLPDSPAVGFGSPAFLVPSDTGLRVDRDFNGRQRPDHPSVEVRANPVTPSLLRVSVMS